MRYLNATTANRAREHVRQGSGALHTPIKTLHPLLYFLGGNIAGSALTEGPLCTPAMEFEKNNLRMWDISLLFSALSSVNSLLQKTHVTFFNRLLKLYLVPRRQKISRNRQPGSKLVLSIVQLPTKSGPEYWLELLESELQPPTACTTIIRILWLYERPHKTNAF